MSSPVCGVRDNGNGSKTLRCSDGSGVDIFDGKTGAGCSASHSADGTKTVSCADGTQVSIRDGKDGLDGKDGGGCSVRDNGAGVKAVVCADGTRAELRDGTPGESCSVGEGEDGSKAITCGDGTHVTVHDGRPGTGCTVVDAGDGSKTIRCGDGTSARVLDGLPGIGCSVEEHPDGSRTLTCADTATVIAPPGRACDEAEHRVGRKCVSDFSVSSCSKVPRDCSAEAIPAEARRLCDGLTCGFACPAGTLAMGGGCVATSTCNATDFSTDTCSGDLDYAEYLGFEPVAFCGGAPGRFRPADKTQHPDDLVHDRGLHGYWSADSLLKMPYADALEHCRLLGMDYRMPSVFELVSLFREVSDAEIRDRVPALDPAFEDVEARYTPYWASWDGPWGRKYVTVSFSRSGCWSFFDSWDRADQLVRCFRPATYVPAPDEP